MDRGEEFVGDGGGKNLERRSRKINPNVRYRREAEQLVQTYNLFTYGRVLVFLKSIQYNG